MDAVGNSRFDIRAHDGRLLRKCYLACSSVVGISFPLLELYQVESNEGCWPVIFPKCSFYAGRIRSVSSNAHCEAYHLWNLLEFRLWRFMEFHFPCASQSLLFFRARPV